MDLEDFMPDTVRQILPDLTYMENLKTVKKRLIYRWFVVVTHIFRMR